MTAAAAPGGAQQLGDAARAHLCDAASYVFWDDIGTVLASSFTAKPEELRNLAGALGDRSNAIKHGLVVDGQRYEVHRHHPPLVYGRTMGVADPDDSVGAALCGVGGSETLTGRPCFGVITYRMPNLSARMVPLLEAFCDKHLRAGGIVNGVA